tara:strand:+ start:40 stop:609 length:570 start_codon:yes stop_codon:yes gene_type:complete
MKNLIFTIVSVFLLASCALTPEQRYAALDKSLQISVSQSFNKSATISVEKGTSFTKQFTEVLTNSLFEYGFEVVANDVAETKRVTESQSENNENLEESIVSNKSSTEYKSIYLLTCAFTAGSGATKEFCEGKRREFNGTSFFVGRITGKIIDLSDGGKVVATINYVAPDTMLPFCIEEIAKIISRKLIE